LFNIAWRGPPSEDIKTIYALEIIFRYLNDNPSSLFPQKFIERSDPYASEIDFELKSYVETSIVLTFYGVPYTSNAEELSDVDNDDVEEKDEKFEEECDENESELESDEDESETKCHRGLFDEGFYFRLMRDAFSEYLENGFKTTEEIHKTIKRHKLKCLEALEESPHEIIAMNIIPDIIRHTFASKSALNDTKTQGGNLNITLKLKLAEIIPILEQEPISYWKDLFKKYIFDPPAFEILMKPSQKLQEEYSKQKEEEEIQNLKLHTTQELCKIKQKVSSAIEENKVNLPLDILAKLPSIPNIADVSQLSYRMTNIALDGADSVFSVVQVIKTNAALCHFGIGFSIKNLPDIFRPYLVLFQELLFQSSVEIPMADKSIATMDYKQVAKYVSEVFISHECGVGFQNSIFSSSYLSQILTIFTTCDPLEWNRAIRFTFQVILFSKFTKERIITVVKNLLTNIVDIKRDGESVLAAVSNRISQSRLSASKYGSNDFFISIFIQEKLLNGILNECESGNESGVIEKLDDIRNFIIHESNSNFMRVGVPLRFSCAQTSESTSNEISQDCLTIWNSELLKYQTRHTIKRKRAERDHISPFPFKRVPFNWNQVDLKFGRNIAVPVGGLSTYSFAQYIPCDLLTTLKDADYFPTLLLAEILSRPEGPLYTGIRGRGYAYGAFLSCYLWTGQISLEIYRSSEPVKALIIFYELLEELCTTRGFEKYCSDYEIETAQASVAYRWASDSATACSLISTALRSSLQVLKLLK
jgi:Zn-dependent M16 (insulinase) family peptidase